MSDTILSIEQIREGLKDKKLLVVANALDISYPTLKKLADGKDLNYTINVIRKVSDYLTINL